MKIDNYFIAAVTSKIPSDVTNERFAKDRESGLGMVRLAATGACVAGGWIIARMDEFYSR